MTWNYRVIRKPDPDGLPDQFEIHEVYYDSAGRIEAWTEEPCTPFGESLDELQADMEMMSQAMSRPVLTEPELVKDLAHKRE
jgi:hypothetical protein